MNALVGIGDLRMLPSADGSACLVLVLQKRSSERGWIAMPVEPNPRVSLLGDYLLEDEGLPLPRVAIAVGLLRTFTDAALGKGELWGSTEKARGISLARESYVKAIAELALTQRDESRTMDLELAGLLLPRFGDNLKLIRERRQSLRQRFFGA